MPKKTKKTGAKEKKSSKLDVQWEQRCLFLKEYVDSDEFKEELIQEGLPVFPIMRYVSMTRNGVIRLLLGRQCVGCKSMHNRNICNIQFATHVAFPFLSDKFSFVFRVRYVSTHHDDFRGIVEGMGGRVSEIINDRERKTFFQIQKFMLDMHPDVDNMVGAVARYNQDVDELLDNEDITTWHATVNGNLCSFVIDDTFKCISIDGTLMDSKYIDEHGGEQCPDNSVVIRGEGGFATLRTTNPLFFHTAQYVIISFD